MYVEYSEDSLETHLGLLFQHEEKEKDRRYRMQRERETTMSLTGCVLYVVVLRAHVHLSICGGLLDIGDCRRSVSTHRQGSTQENTGEVVPFGHVCFERNHSEEGAMFKMRWM